MKTTLDVLAGWRRVGMVDPTALVDARLQLHHALQIIVSAPISFLQARPDDSHTNLEWLHALEALGTNWLEGPSRIRFGLRPADFALLEIAATGTVQAIYPLRGHTVGNAVEWLRRALDRAGYGSERLTTKKHYEIPGHAVAAGATFSLQPDDAFAELACYYANAHAVTVLVAGARAGASAPRCWPHHFDLGTLITLPESTTGRVCTVGVGLSPGDDSYAAPYFYVGPYPYPPADRLKRLTLGAWHTSGWVGAVLRATDLVRLETEQQSQAVLAFANEAVEASIEALNCASPSAIPQSKPNKSYTTK